MKKSSFIFGLFFMVSGFGLANCMQDKLPPYRFELHHDLSWHKEKLRHFVSWHIERSKDCNTLLSGVISESDSTEKIDSLIGLKTAFETCITTLKKILDEIPKQPYSAEFYKLYEKYVDVTDRFKYVKGQLDEILSN